MKTVFLFLVIVPVFAVSANAPSFELTKDFWNNPAFVRSFMGDYGFRTEIEPRISKAESFIIREVIAKSENQLEEAIAYLEENTNNCRTLHHC